MNKNKKGILVDGSLRSAGVTFFTRNGQTIARTSVSMQPERRTLKQFILRQRLEHSVSLWYVLKRHCRELMTQHSMPYSCFMSLAAKLPTVYLTRSEYANGGALLLPRTPVSLGTLPDIGYHLGEWQSTPALLTDLSPTLLQPDDTLRLVILRQTLRHGLPKVVAAHLDLKPSEFVDADGRLALAGEWFDDSQCGWALVLTRRGACSSQTVVTRCTLYRQYTTPEAMQRAADSYGGLTP